MKVLFDLDKKMDYATKEAFNRLKTNLRFCGQDKRAISVTSCGENEGKSSVCRYLAIANAEDGKKVLVIDADMRKSVWAGELEFEGNEDSDSMRGLSHYLSGQAEMSEIICASNIEGFDLVLAGPVPPNPSGLLEQVEFKKLVEYARENYDLVIIDLPPLGMVIDAAIAAKYSDGAMILIEAFEVKYKMVAEVKKQLELSGCEVLGVILNKVPRSTNGYYSRYYSAYRNYGYYNRYSGKYGESE